MSNTTRQSNLLVNQDWTKIYESFSNADFQSYDFQTLRKAMIDYLRLYYPEDFNDFTESSEYIALIDLIAYLGQNLAFRNDLNTRENFLETAERRDSVLKLAKLVNYVPKRNIPAAGFLKFESVQTTEQILDSDGNDLTNLIIKWNDSTNINWFEQFILILNATLPTNQNFGKPGNSQYLSGVKHDEYGINLPPGTMPIYKFQSSIDSNILGFEVVGATSLNESYIYEVPPNAGNPLNILYKNDNKGNASNNTGFFFYFKQGNLQSQNFSITEKIANNLVSVNYDNINNSDVWLYELNNIGTSNILWNKIPSIVGQNIIYNNQNIKTSYQVNSRANDQIDLVFGDNVFAKIPQGNFKCYFRVSAGLTYKITPDEIKNVNFSIPYISRSGRLETLTVVASLKSTVITAQSRETITDIKLKAPQQYYTQNRMVSGEDYNVFPYTNFSSLSKVKAVNRVSSGTSRYLDVIDSTGRYSSTNIFCDDGILYSENVLPNFTFTWSTTSEINAVIQNQILPVIRSKSLMHFYYSNFARFTLSNLYWNQSTAGAGSSTGYFTDSSGNIQQIGINVTGNNSYINQNSIVIFSPGSGNYFDSANLIKPIPDSGIIPASGNSLLYVTVISLIGNASQGNDINDIGPVLLSEFVPTDAQAITVIPAFSNDFTNTFLADIIAQISSYKNFGIRYDQSTRAWAIINVQDLSSNSLFSQTNQGDKSGLNKDASWLLTFEVTGTVYSITYRGLNYIFESVNQTKFYYDNTTKIFDPVTGRTINDYINILKTNGKPDTFNPLEKNIVWYIYNQIKDTDGYVNSSRVQITFSDTNSDGVPDNPDIFTTVVDPSVNPTSKLIFFEKELGYSNFVNYIPISSGLIVVDYDTKLNIQLNINNYTDGQIFYATSEELFYVLSVNNSVYTLNLSNNYIVRTGRNTLSFQYRHNSPGNRRLDPSPNNIIDLYLLTKVYENDYRRWAIDTTGSVSEPSAPTSEELRQSYYDLENYKSISDALIYSSAKFKPLFGSKADSGLQATFKIIKNPKSTVSDSEIKSRVLTYINAYFNTDNWDFGETFYFTELATYIQQNLSPLVVSINLVPNSTSQIYGSLQQISCNPDEIFISCATVDNIEVITSITATQLNLDNYVVNNTIVN